MQTYGSVEVYVPTFLISVIDGGKGESSASNPDRFAPEK
jgi:hypothetical protein